MRLIDAANFEYCMSEAMRADGVPVAQDVPLNAWTLNTGAPLAASGANVVGMGAVATDLRGMIWDPAADNADIVRLETGFPLHWRKGHEATGQRGAFILAARARKVDAGSNPDNTDLTLVARAFWHNHAYTTATGLEKDGDTEISNVANITMRDDAGAILGADVADASEQAFRWYYANISKAIFDASAANWRALKPGASLNLTMGLNEAPGTGLSVHVVQTRLIYCAHLVPPAAQDMARLRF